jgi:uncharacterized protein with FMN-binding domain
VKSREPPTGPSKKVSNNLVALGSAAVLTIYAAGYARTRPAAQRFAVEDAARMPAVRLADSSAASAVIPQPTVEAPPRTGRSSAALTRNRPPGEASSARRASPSVAASEMTRAAAAPVTDTQSTPVKPVGAAPVAAPASGASTAGGTTSATDTAAQPAPKARVPYRDGTYSGWGTSRHGDIQASVEILGGRITAATITQCLTRYSCSWISALPPQVLARQSAEVDYVSGATQSANAFYQAVVEALSKAR